MHPEQNVYVATEPLVIQLGLRTAACKTYFRI